jgi:hypothetical protein
MMHEGDVYFERCYGADFASEFGVQQKEACWQAWVAHYTKHQPAHRVDYALGRIESLQNGERPPELPGLLRGALPPQEVARELDAAAAAASDTSAALLSPLMQGDGGVVPNGCAHYCGEFEQQCRARCLSAGRACDEGCERERAVCLNGCH